MKEIIVISVSEFSMNSAYDIESKTNDLCKRYNVRCYLEDKRALWGAKVSAILDGKKDDIDIIKKALKVDFKVKSL